ncbi:GNAT family N-acetyltransferase [Acidovorax sp. NCPPB 3859]|nr:MULTISPECIES: GNAT family N-acetyltransferase [unclassified Acidovorax]MDA8450465.1 GNAT family N-acetyltransferase [Acidovorax sp. GBBC 3297]MDA8459861.1 GNAT family N-acetyltransferase [Acidovorax sp. GBBC 3333]MDA8464897.1 GNAT family N-acetyltransferase [Acidovorax sp. GBBC 3332]MDA8469980.1 GNAT family N-acetyltransferase [Acidovorax sp. GBBC 3299]WCM77426.1 GNAT family N-acetyltransferase [Acidovorax sp. GBBC 712]
MDARPGAATAALRIRLDDLSDPRIAVFLEEHLADMRRVSPPESVHALDLDGLRRPEIRFWSAWLETPHGDQLAGTVALKRLDAGHAELKSMRTATALRGQGIAARMLAHALAEARAAGHARISLETGSQPFFAPARALYARHGFEDCAPFGSYGPDPASHFMTRAL